MRKKKERKEKKQQKTRKKHMRYVQKNIIYEFVVQTAGLHLTDVYILYF